MAEQTESSGAGRASGPQLAVSEEDAGRLDAASRWRLTAVIVALVLFAEAITFGKKRVLLICGAAEQVTHAAATEAAEGAR